MRPGDRTDIDLGASGVYRIECVDRPEVRALFVCDRDELRSQGLAAFQAVFGGDLMSRISSDTDRLCNFLSSHLVDFATDVLMIGMTVAIMLAIDPLLADPKARWSDPAITTHGFNNHAVRSEQWRYIRYSDGSLRNLILLDLKGGCDGLNMVVPFGVDGGTYSSVFRQSLAIPQGLLLPVSGSIGLNPRMTALKSHFDAGRLAIVQGVSYPQPSFSHEVAQAVWQTGEPSGFGAQGWLGKHLAASGGPGPQAVSVDDNLTLLLDGSGGFVPAFTDIGQFTFPYDGWNAWDKANRQAAYAAVADGLAGHPKASLAAMSSTSAGLLALIDQFAALPTFAHVGAYPDTYLSDLLKAVVQLLHGNLGLRYFHVPFGGWDTHADQESDDYHSERLGLVSDALDALWQDLSALGVAGDTLVVVFSESMQAESLEGAIEIVPLVGGGLPGTPVTGLSAGSKATAHRILREVSGQVRSAVPSAVPVYAKTGTLTGVRAEAAVVEVQGRPFSLAVMTTYLANDEDAIRAIREIAATAYSYFDRLAKGGAHGRR